MSLTEAKKDYVDRLIFSLRAINRRLSTTRSNDQSDLEPEAVRFEKTFVLLLFLLSIFVVSDKMSEARTIGKVKKEYFDLDDVLESEIKFGKYQIFQFLLIAFPIFLNGIFTSAYIFTAGTLNYR